MNEHQREVMRQAIRKELADLQGDQRPIGA